MTVLQDLIGLAFPFIVGLVALIFYVGKKKPGMLVIATAFFLEAVRHILLGATMLHYFYTSGGGVYAWGWYTFVVGFGFQIAFTVLLVIGLFMLYKEIT